VGIEVIPAIDISGGRLARPTAAGVAPVDGAFDGDPLAAARAFVDAGARWLHVVDLDLAATGRAVNAGVLRRIARESARVQASGGIRSRDDVETLLAAGASRVVLGSGTLDDIEEVFRLVADYRDELAIGLEIEGGRVRSRGVAGLDLPLEETMDDLAAIAPPRVVVTALGRVGRLAGPDVPTLALVAGRLHCPIVAAGGIGSIADLDLVRSIDGVEAAIVGRAALESRLDVRAAIAAGR
jgi:phosphoribosyl isomerase A